MNKIVQTEAEGVIGSPSKIEGARGSMTSAEKMPPIVIPQDSEKKIPCSHQRNTKNLKMLRRSLRNNSTPAECQLWLILRRNQIEDLHFRRQYSVGKHILDFYCPSLSLAIELDGDHHFLAAKQEADAVRDEELLRIHQIRTLRFENRIVFEQHEAIINSIKEIARQRGL